MKEDSYNTCNATFSFARSILPWLMVACGMLFYCYNFFLRVSPSVMQEDLTQTFHLSATQFGTLAGFYYWGYVPMQIPGGLLYDKFGVRPVLSMACLVASLGLWVFVSSNNYGMAGCGRFLIGLGCAFAYIGTLKLAALWLPANRFATAACTTTAVGTCAGALSQRYLTHAVGNVGYQHALASALFAGIGLSLLVMLFVRNKPKNVLQDLSADKPGSLNFSQLLVALRLILSNPQMWLIGAIGCFSYFPSSVFLDLWGIPYLKAVHGLTAEQAVTISSYTFAGWIIAGPIIGMVSDRIRRRRLPLIVTGTIAASLLCVVFYVPGLNLLSLNLIFFTIGFCCGSHPLCFALGKENNPVQFAATSVAITNMLIMASGAIFQPIVGKLLDFHASGEVTKNGLLVYSASDYTFALSIVPMGVIFSIFLSFFLKETHCKTVSSVPDELKILPETA